MKKIIILSLLFSSLLIQSNLKADAGSIPSVSEICNSLTGAAYGLCVAGCEAALIENDTTSKAFEKVSSNFTKITGDQLPCLEPPVSGDCPCDLVYGISLLKSQGSVRLFEASNDVGAITVQCISNVDDNDYVHMGYTGDADANNLCLALFSPEPNGGILIERVSGFDPILKPTAGSKFSNEQGEKCRELIRLNCIWDRDFRFLFFKSIEGDVRHRPFLGAQHGRLRMSPKVTRHSPGHHIEIPLVTFDRNY